MDLQTSSQYQFYLGTPGYLIGSDFEFEPI